jgi:hypothetical protein
MNKSEKEVFASAFMKILPGLLDIATKRYRAPDEGVFLGEEDGDRLSMLLAALLLGMKPEYEEVALDVLHRFLQTGVPIPPVSRN